MDREHIEALHEQAAEAYLSGNYAEALRLWQQLLAGQPGDERAEEGVRLCRGMMGGKGGPEIKDEGGQSPLGTVPGHPELSLDFDLDSIPGREKTKEVEGELDRGLSRLDGPAAEIPEHDPARQSEGLDLGGNGEEAPIELGESVPADEPRRGLDGINDMANAQPEAEPEDLLGGEDLLQGDAGAEEKGLAAVSSNPLDAAAMELQARVHELLAEARHALESGQPDEARGIVERIRILDEGNGAALELLAEIDGGDGGADSRVEDWLAEGAQLFGLEQYEQAREVFSQVLEVSPSHAEAEHYIEKIDAALSGGPVEDPGGGHDEPGLSHEPQEQEPGVEGLPLAGGAPLASEGEDLVLDESAPEEAPPVPPAKAGLGRLLLVAAAVTALGVGGWYGYSRFLGGSEADGSAATTPDRPARGPAATASAELPAGNATSAPAPELPMDPAAMGAALERARAAYEREDYEQAILAYNEVLRFDPEHAEARAGLVTAGERFRELKAESEKLERARTAFNDRAYSSALKLLYRLPDTVDPSLRDRNIVSGWFNLGVIELKGGDCAEAIRYFDEALALADDDHGLLQARVFAESFRDEPKDARYFRAVEAMPLRPWASR